MKIHRHSNDDSSVVEYLIRNANTDSFEDVLKGITTKKEKPGLQQIIAQLEGGLPNTDIMPPPEVGTSPLTEEEPETKCDHKAVVSSLIDALLSAHGGDVDEACSAVQAKSAEPELPSEETFEEDIMPREETSGPMPMMI